MVAVEHGNVKTFPVEGKEKKKNLEIVFTNIFSVVLEKSDIVDTNGAGDAFVGGFLAQWVLGNVRLISHSFPSQNPTSHISRDWRPQ